MLRYIKKLYGTQNMERLLLFKLTYETTSGTQYYRLLSNIRRTLVGN